MKNRVLVPLDGTLPAEQAIPFAVALARRTGAELQPVLVHLTDYYRDLGFSPGSAVEGDRALALREAEYLASITDGLAGSGAKVHPPEVLHGEVPDAVVEHVASGGITAVVMATNGRGALERLLVPSVAQGLRHRLRVPMILVRADPDAPPESPQGWADAKPPGVVLAALDGSLDAEDALDVALRVAGSDARYVLLRVVSLPPQLSSVYLPQATIFRHRDEERLRAEAAEYLDGVAARIRSRVPRVEKRLGVHSRPAHLILQASEEVGADLISVGSHGRGALRETLFGSVTNDVLRESRVPVLVTRPEG